MIEPMGEAAGRSSASNSSSHRPSLPSLSLLKLARNLVGATLAYNGVEAVVALWSGEAADSVALISFGLDSSIETAASAFALYRIQKEIQGIEGEALERMETRIHRFVGFSFLALFLWVGGQAIWTLTTRQAPETSQIGLALAALSAALMPSLSLWKIKVARALKSRALLAEAKETLACSFLSVILLVGLGLNTLFGWWWADPIAALAMLPWLWKEGWEGVRGEHCHDHEPGHDCH
jgi:divalent metal cation (Fe/Co/Zn/Cd) transporter